MLKVVVVLEKGFEFLGLDGEQEFRWLRLYPLAPTAWAMQVG